MKNKLGETLNQYAMVEKGDRVAVALSGGADSVALLLGLVALAEELSITLTACHVNHGIRGEEANRDETFVQNLCGELSVPLTTFHVDVPTYAKEKGISLELAAREKRYELLSTLPVDKIATAHTLSDNLETVLFSTLRGTGLKGLCGIPPVRLPYIRPLIGVKRQEVEAYLLERKQSYVTDSSNLSPEYTRNALRLQVVPTLLSLFPQGEEGIKRLTESVAIDYDFIHTETLKAYNRLSSEKGICREDFLALPKSLQNHLLLYLLKEKGIESRAKRVEQMLGLIALGKGKLEMQKNCYFFVDLQYFFLRTVALPTENSVHYKAVLEKEEISFIPKSLTPDYGSIYRINLSETTGNSYKNHTNLLLDYDKLESTFILRNREVGDRFQTAGRKGSKSLKKLFNEQKIPLERREQLLLMESGGEIVAIEEIGVSSTVAVTPNTKKIIVVSF